MRMTGEKGTSIMKDVTPTGRPKINLERGSGKRLSNPTTKHGGRYDISKWRK